MRNYYQTDKQLCPFPNLPGIIILCTIDVFSLYLTTFHMTKVCLLCVKHTTTGKRYH